jgi:hypothetical protein
VIERVEAALGPDVREVAAAALLLESATASVPPMQSSTNRPPGRRLRSALLK